MADKTLSNSMSRLLTSTAIIGTAFLPYNSSAAEEKATQLPTVTVVGSGSSGAYNATESSYYKLSGPLVNTPKTVSTVTRQLMMIKALQKFRKLSEMFPEFLWLQVKLESKATILIFVASQRAAISSLMV